MQPRPKLLGRLDAKVLGPLRVVTGVQAAAP
jgi:hypothetical protein